MSNRTIIIGAIAVVVVSFLGATFLINLLWPSSLQEGRPQLVAVPPLKPLAGKSTILARAAVGDPRCARGTGAAQSFRQAAKFGFAIAAER